MTSLFTYFDFLQRHSRNPIGTMHYEGHTTCLVFGLYTRII